MSPLKLVAIGIVQTELVTGNLNLCAYAHLSKTDFETHCFNGLLWRFRERTVRVTIEVVAPGEPHGCTDGDGVFVTERSKYEAREAEKNVKQEAEERAELARLRKKYPETP